MTVSAFTRRYLRRPPLRRRRGVTLYRKRLKLVRSSLPRFVVRKTNRHVLVQVIQSKAGGDTTIVTANSKELTKYGWTKSRKNMPAAYLTGFLAGRLAIKKGVKEAVPDIGLNVATKGARVLVAVQGAIDSGLGAKLDKSVLPEESRIRGKNIDDFLTTMSKDREQGDVQNMGHQVMFESVKQRIQNEVVSK